MRVYVEVYGAQLEVIERPEYEIAHPGDGWTGRCNGCALAVRPDTGELVLLWRCGQANWGVSRETPEYERHHAEISRLGLTDLARRVYFSAVFTVFPLKKGTA